MNIQDVIELSELAKARSRDYPLRRNLYWELASQESRHFTGVVGPRGVGKTVLLQQLADAMPDALYLSADTLEPDADGFDLIRRLAEQFKYRFFFLDEIHHLKEAAGMLKKLYDFLDVRVVFTSSVALAMEASRFDLSRRVRLLTLRTFSYREYLRFVKGMELLPLSLPEILDGHWLPEHLRAGGQFDEYLRGGNLPFALEEAEPLPLLENIRDKIIGRDIPSVLQLTMDELNIFPRMLRFIGRSEVDGINYSSISRNLGITKYKANQYVSSMEQAFVLRQVFPAGTNVLREPKVLMMPPYRLLYRDLEDAIGGLREDFCVEALTQAGYDIAYLKSMRGTKTPDYFVHVGDMRVAVEIGGSGKGREQFKGVQADHKIVFAQQDAPEGGRLPLFLLGLS